MTGTPKQKTHILMGVLSLLLLSFPCASSRAEGASSGNIVAPPAASPSIITRKASTLDEIGVAFLKMSNNFPDFNKVVEDGAAYKKLDPLAQRDFKAKEVERLQNAFVAFAPKKSDLVVRLGVKLGFTEAKDKTGSLDILFPSGAQDGPLYFPFYFAGYPIALIIDRFELFRHITLSADEVKLVYRHLGVDGAATLVLQVFPVAADDKAQVTLDAMAQYPMLAEIAYIGLLNTRAETIWSWQSPKYGVKKASPLSGLSQ